MDPRVFEILTTPPVGPLMAGLWGALWGSFLNVVIVRLPRGESVLRPGSHCVSCGKPVRFYDNIPVLSYLILRGRCRHCRAPFSPRYLLIELLSLVLALACFYHAIRTGTGSASARLAGFLVEFFFVAGLLAVAFIDLGTMIIPNAITYPMVCLLPPCAVALGRLPWWNALVGAVAGFGTVWLVAIAYRALRGEEGIGLGDGKLLAVIGGFLGWQALPLVLLLGSLQGLLAAVPLLLAGRSLVATQTYKGLTDAPADGEDRPESAEEKALPEDLHPRAVPFGPFLALAAVEVLLFGQQLTAWISRILDQWI